MWTFSVRLDDRLQELFGIANLLEHQRDVQGWLARMPRTLAVDAMLANGRERIGQEIESDGELATRRAHHRLVNLELIAMFVEDGHGHPFRGGWAGRISTRLGRLRDG